jgi:hypothetical protein
VTLALQLEEQGRAGVTEGTDETSARLAAELTALVAALGAFTGERTCVS